MEGLEILYLPDEEEVIKQVADWHYSEFGKDNPDSTPEKTLNTVRGRVNNTGIPLCLVAYLGGRPVGTASIIATDMKTHAEFMPWMADVVVDRGHRDRGIGSALVRRVDEEMGRLNISVAYLFTPDKERMYARLGWKTVLRETYRGKDVVIMRKEFP